MNQLQRVVERVNTLYLDRSVAQRLKVAFGIRVDSIADFKLTPDRPYLARADIDIMVGNDQLKLITLAMMDGDGTGNESSYKAETLTIPAKFRNLGIGAVPRRKTSISVEGAIPLFTFNPSGDRVKMFDSTLLELWLQDAHRVTDIAQLTAPFDSPVKSDGNPHIYYTVWHDRGGVRFGDPHAIAVPQGSQMIQVISFLAAEDTRGNVFDLLNNKGMMPQQKRRW